MVCGIIVKERILIIFNSTLGDHIQYRATVYTKH